MAFESEMFKDSKEDKNNLKTLQSLPTIRNKLTSIYRQDRFKQEPNASEVNMILGKHKFRTRNKSVFNYNTEQQRPFSIADSEIQRQSEFGHIPSKISLAESFVTPIHNIKHRRSPVIKIQSSVAFLPQVETPARVIVNDYHV